MTIQKDYYEAEVRDGFYVSSEMKRCWAATIGVLEVIDRICTKYDLQYYAEYGTLLGAVRCRGFIPWDDDFDISMKRDDYLKFLKVARDELPEDYVLLSVYNNHEYDNFLSRVVNRSFISIEKDFLDANHNFPFAVGIDIFPLDYFEYNENENELIKNIIESAIAIIAILDPNVSDMNDLDEPVRVSINRLCDMCVMPIEDGRPIRQQIYIMIERVCAIYDKKAPYLTNMYFWVKHSNQVYKKECFENTVRLPFEYFEICAPIGYDTKLIECYGTGYMIPYKGGGMHDYPLYGKQKDLLFETTGKNYFPKYRFVEDDLKRPTPGTPVEQRSRKETVFLPFKAKYWRYMEKEWELAVRDENTDVYVIPIPYFDKGLYGQIGDIHYEADMFPDHVPVTAFDWYDFDNRIPDRIVIQNPYDEYDNAITVHPRFYSGNLLSSTKELVYIPYFSIDDTGLDDEKTLYASDFYVKTPAVVRSDKVYLQSEAVKMMYVDRLCDLAGEESRPLWDAKLIARPELQPDVTDGIREEDIPNTWWKYLLDENEEGKKVILYHTSVSDIVTYGSKALDKIKRVLEVFRQNRDVMTPIWHAHPSTQIVLKMKYPKLWKQYKAILEDYLEKDYGIYEDAEDYSRIVAISDAFYGDRDAIMHDFMETKRPVMVANIDI